MDAAPLYGPDDLEGKDLVRDLGVPGKPPFTRGVQPNMYRGRLWTMRQYAGFGTADESNERYRYLLAQGQTGLSVAFDLPTQMGRDSDDPKAQGEVGRVGVAIDSLDDMRTLFRGLPLDKISTSMTINATAGILFCLYLAVAEESGVPRGKVRGTIQNDILKEYMARGTYIYPPRPSIRLITDVFAFCGARGPQVEHDLDQRLPHPRGGLRRGAGGRVHAGGRHRLREAALDAGLDVDAFGAQLSFFFNVHNNLIEEVAKFRAARRLWSRIMLERFGAKTDRARALRFHCQTAGATLTAQQPLNNVVRVTVQTLAAVLGGCQSLHTNSFDEALGLPTNEAATIALRTQQIVAHESGIADFVDALGGSYAIESLTDRVEREAEKYLGRIAELGGMVSAIEQGYPQREIQNSAYQYQLEIERKQRLIVGQNAFTQEAPRSPSCAWTRSSNRSRSRASAPSARDARQPRTRRPSRNRARGEGDGQPPTAHPRGGEGRGDRGRDLRRAARRVGRAPGDAGALVRLAASSFRHVVLDAEHAAVTVP